MATSKPALLVRSAASLATLVALHPAATDQAAMVAVFIVLWLLFETSSENRSQSFFIAVGAMLCGSLLFSGLAPSITTVLFVVLVEKILKTTAFKGERLAAWIASLAFTQIPPVTTGLLSLAELGPSWIGLVATPITFIFAGALSGLLRLFPSLLASGITLGVAVFGSHQEWSPSNLSALCALAPVALVLVPSTCGHKCPLLAPAFFAITCISALAWMLPASTTTAGGGIWLPEGKSSSSRYYEEYASVLSLTGFSGLRQIEKASEIKPGELIIFPHAAHPEFIKQLQALRGLSHYQTLRILVIGEHTDANGVATALNHSGSPIGLNIDTTIPPRNTDFLGWVGATGATPSPKAAINRGASVQHRSFFTAPLLWIVGGHRETDISDDGRLGDSIFRSNEQVGPYAAMSIGLEIEGPTWIVLGDSTPALNELLVGDPASFASLLALSTGIPAVIAMLTWILLCAASIQTSERMGITLLSISMIAAISIPVSATLLSGKFMDTQKSRITIADRDLYGDRAVGRALVMLAKDLVRTETRLEVGKVSSQTSEKLVSIGHPKGWSMRLDCSRAGGISVDQLRVLDVITCPEARQDSILVVGEDAISYRRQSQTVVLDQHFIANAAPPQNIEWIRKQLDASAASK